MSGTGPKICFCRRFWTCFQHFSRHFCDICSYFSVSGLSNDAAFSGPCFSIQCPFCHHSVGLDQRVEGGNTNTTQFKHQSAHFQTYKTKHRIRGREARGVRARYAEELPPFVAIVRRPGRPVVSGLESQQWKLSAQTFWGVGTSS